MNLDCVALSVGNSAVADAAAVMDAVDTFPDPVLILDEGCRIAGVNEAAMRLLDVDRHQLIGGRADAWLLEDGSGQPSSPRFRDAVAACGAHPTRLQCAARRSDGSSVCVEVALSRPRCIGTEHVVVSVRDLSELRALQFQLQAAKSELRSAARSHDRLLAVLGHELRTPLNAIVGYSTIMLGERRDTPLATQALRLQVMHAAAQQMLLLSDDLLRWGQLACGHLRTNAVAIDVAELVRNVHATMLPLAATKKLEFRLAPLTNHLTINSDPGVVRQVLANLIANAIKYTDRGSVSIDARCIEDAVHITVKDTGIGISTSDQKHLFEDFSQLGARPGDRGGAGLGLSLCARLAARLGGHIAVNSELGLGSVFTLVLPAAVTSPNGTSNG